MIALTYHQNTFAGRRAGSSSPPSSPTPQFHPIQQGSEFPLPSFEPETSASIPVQPANHVRSAIDNAKAIYVSDDTETLSLESGKGDFGAQNGQQLVSQGTPATSQDIITHPNELPLCSSPMKMNLKLEQVSPHTSSLTTLHPIQFLTDQLHYELPNNSTSSKAPLSCVTPIMAQRRSPPASAPSSASGSSPPTNGTSPSPTTSSKTIMFILDILTCVILYNNFFPISFIETMEVVKYQQAQLINSDLDMSLLLPY
ncbi:hypothetical protein M422DRAFT_242258 [Sphaerobolus stellatus SS14]|nr:hypothetical protein M422DRAFT_242258 [Sphaerobolus stellatus SS14]